MAGKTRNRKHEACPHCFKVMRTDHITRHMPKCKANPFGLSNLIRTEKKEQARASKLLKTSIKIQKKTLREMERVNKIHKKHRAQVKQSLTKFKMRQGIDVAAVGRWYRANARKAIVGSAGAITATGAFGEGTDSDGEENIWAVQRKKPIYLQWIEAKFKQIVLKKMRMHGIVPVKAYLNKWWADQFKENKKVRDRLRRRLLLDYKIAVNYQICWFHGKLFFPLCRTKLSDFYWSRRCPECFADKQDALDLMADLAEKRERASFGIRYIGFMIPAMARWLTERSRLRRRRLSRRHGPLTRGQLIKLQAPSTLIQNLVENMPIPLGFVSEPVEDYCDNY